MSKLGLCMAVNPKRTGIVEVVAHFLDHKRPHGLQGLNEKKLATNGGCLTLKRESVFFLVFYYFSEELLGKGVKKVCDFKQIK